MHWRIVLVKGLLIAGIPAVACGQEAMQSPVNAESMPAMVTASPDAGFRVRVLFTVGDRIGDYRPPGKLDGLGAWRVDEKTLRVLANHEFGSQESYPYELANGTELRGSRVSFFDIDIRSFGIREAGLAFDRMRDRRGAEVTRAAQVSERGDAPGAGLNALCSAAAYGAGEAGFADDIFLTNEEVSAREDHPHGGTVWGLDVAGRELWALPDLGRGSWENVAAVAAPPGFVALLMGDDIEFGRAPLYLYLGRKDPAGDFPARNGLRNGRLHVWVSDQDDRSPADWRGTGAQRAGHFVPIAARQADRAGRPGYDTDGYLDDTTLREAAWRLGAFGFSRPEDVHTNPALGSQAVLSSTGYGKDFPQDDWGTLYRIDMRFDGSRDGFPRVAATLTILHDGDDFGGRTIRSPDNLTWASDGMVYVQEDKAVKRAQFTDGSATEASIWRLDPRRPADYERIAVIDRSVLVPPGVRDTKAGRPGAWESSGIIDITPQLQWPQPRLVLLFTVQAHGLRGGPVDEALREGGQLLLLERD